MLDTYPLKVLAAGLKEHKHARPWRVPEFRTSSLPFCPIMQLRAWMEQTPGEKSYAGDFYFEMGTKVHEMIQWNLANHPEYGRKAFGFWNCNQWGCQTKTEKPGFRPAESPACHPLAGWHYKEIEFQYKGLSGHCDFITRAEKKWWLFEFKTASINVVRPGAHAPYHPMPKHLIQAQTYCVLLWLLFKIRINYYSLMYVSREKPDTDHMKVYTHHMTREIYRYRLQQMRREIAGNDALKEALPKLVKEWDEEAVKKVIEARPCHSRDEYFERMDSSFFADNRCPYFADGSCAKEKVPNVSKHLHQLWKHTNREVIENAIRGRPPSSD